ncbi:MAG: hypothetical protein WCX46_03895 [Candidatus Paceibacterota bacterium]
MLIDIVILPPTNIRNKIGTKIKKEMGSLSNYFVVDNNKLIPHLSLWHMKTSKKNVDKITQELKKVIKNQKPIKITSSEFHALEKFKGCLEFTIKENKNLSVFRQNIFEKIYSYKTGIMPQFASFLKIKYSKEKLKEIQKYGRGLGFGPHFTMGWLKNENDISKVIKKMNKVKFSFPVNEIYICEIDKWWQVKKIIKKINIT